jgi:hypothetical protein
MRQEGGAAYEEATQALAIKSGLTISSHIFGQVLR